MSQSDLESRLWTELQRRTNADGSRAIRLAKFASDHTPAHKEQAINIIKKWANAGYVRTTGGGTRVILTEKGRQTDSIVDAT